MLFTSSSQWVVLALVLVGGWLLGLASHPGGRRWRDRYTAERDAHLATRRDGEARLGGRDTVVAPVVAATTHTDHDQRLAEAQRRIAELEHDNTRLAQPAPATRVMPVTPVVTPEPNTVTGAYPQRMAASAPRPISPDDRGR